MSIYKSAVNKPVTTMMIFAAIILFGLYSMTKIPIDLYPDMEMPAISVMTVYAGANAADIEENITKPIENSLTTVDKLKEISSTSKDNLSIVSLEFEWGSDLDVATNDIRDALEMVLSDLPDGCERPKIY